MPSICLFFFCTGFWLAFSSASQFATLTVCQRLTEIVDNGLECSTNSEKCWLGKMLVRHSMLAYFSGLGKHEPAAWIELEFTGELWLHIVQIIWAWEPRSRRRLRSELSKTIVYPLKTGDKCWESWRGKEIFLHWYCHLVCKQQDSIICPSYGYTKGQKGRGYQLALSLIFIIEFPNICQHSLHLHFLELS